jgi:hypothetical protein
VPANFCVMPGLVPGIHIFGCRTFCKTWMPATSAGMRAITSYRYRSFSSWNVRCAFTVGHSEAMML